MFRSHRRRRHQTPPPVVPRDRFNDAIVASDGLDVTHRVVVTALDADRVDGRSELLWTLARYHGRYDGKYLTVTVPEPIAAWFKRNLLVKQYPHGCGMNITDSVVRIEPIERSQRVGAAR
jgi:hypothetical protein